MRKPRQGRRKIAGGRWRGCDKPPARAPHVHPLPRVHRANPRVSQVPLTEAETATLVARFDTVGPDRLGDVVLDLTPDALGAWLTDPDAR